MITLEQQGGGKGACVRGKSEVRAKRRQGENRAGQERSEDEGTLAWWKWGTGRRRSEGEVRGEGEGDFFENKLDLANLRYLCRTMRKKFCDRDRWAIESFCGNER